MEFLTSAPLLTELRSKGSTFYTISTALSDLDKTLMDSNYVMSPSRFACINIPEWGRWSNTQSIFEEPEHIGNPLTTNPNIILPKIIQNYIENAIAATMSERVDNGLQTIAESMFWKMMTRLGGLKTKADTPILDNNVLYNTYIEDDGAFDNTYKRIITYVSDINVINHVSKDGQGYTEVYMHIPTQAGMQTNTQFIESSFDFRLNELPEFGGPDYTVGLEDHPLSNTAAIYDTDDKKYTFYPNDKLGLYFDGIDNAIVNTEDIAEGFEFNAVLVYYDIWNRNDSSDRATNLYGILFLDKFEDTGAGTYKIQTLDKYTPDTVNTGNGYAIRLNLKTTSNQSQTSSEVSINDYNSVSMELYMDALRRLNDVTDLYEQAIININTIQLQYNEIVKILPQLSTISALQQTVQTLQQTVTSNQQTYRVSNEELFDMFRIAVEETKSTTKNVNAQMIIGNYIFDDNGVPNIIDPNNESWHWDMVNEMWVKNL